jgi:hypothetical protein
MLEGFHSPDLQSGLAPLSEGILIRSMIQTVSNGTVEAGDSETLSILETRDAVKAYIMKPGSTFFGAPACRPKCLRALPAALVSASMYFSVLAVTPPHAPSAPAPIPLLLGERLLEVAPSLALTSKKLS